MNKKMKLNLLAMTLLVSQQIYCGEDKKQNVKNPIDAQSVKPSDSYLTWKNAKIAGAVVGTAALAGAAYYYKDALMSLVKENSDPAAVSAQVRESIEAKNAEVTQGLHAIAEQENNVAKLEEFQALPDDTKAQIVAELTTSIAQAEAPAAIETIAVEQVPTAEQIPAEQIAAEQITAEQQAPIVTDMPVAEESVVQTIKTPSAPAVDNQVPEAPQAVPMYDWENKPVYSAVAYGLNGIAAAGRAIYSPVDDAVARGYLPTDEEIYNRFGIKPTDSKPEPTQK